MTDVEKADMARLMADKAFLGFMYRLLRSAGIFSSASPDRSLEYVEGRRSLALEALREMEELQADKSPDGLPVLSSIQILLCVAQMASKEKTLGRRNDIYGDIGSD